MEPKVFRDALISSYRVKIGRTRENQGIYSLNSWEKGAVRVVSERRKAQLHKIQVRRRWNTVQSRKEEMHNVQLPKRDTVTHNLGYLKSFNV